MNIVNAYHQRGVKLAVGTDVGNAWMTPGFVFHHELQLYQEAGIPPLAILKMATQNGAEALGILQETGTIEAGKLADIIVLEKNPLEDIKNTLSIHSVFRQGALLTRNK